MSIPLEHLIAGNDYWGIINVRGDPKYGGLVWLASSFNILEVLPWPSSGATIRVKRPNGLHRSTGAMVNNLILNPKTYDIQMYDDFKQFRHEVMLLRLKGIAVNDKTIDYQPLESSSGS